MPFLLDDEEKKKQEEAAGGPMLSGPSGTIVGQPGQPSGLSQKGPTKSGSFTNLNAYLDANKEQAADMAGQVAGKVGEQAQQAKQSVDTLGQGFSQKVKDNTQIAKQEDIDSAASEPVSFAGNFSKVLGGYKGPEKFEDEESYKEAGAKLSQAKTQLQATESESGRLAMLQDQFKKPTYSKGQQRLDQLLMQNSPEAREQFSSVRNQFSDLDGYLSNAASASNALVDPARAATEASKKAIEDRFLGAVGESGVRSGGEIAKQLDPARHEFLLGQIWDSRRRENLTPLEQQFVPISEEWHKKALELNARRDLTSGEKTILGKELVAEYKGKMADVVKNTYRKMGFDLE